MRRDARAVSPVVGSVLLIGIVVAVAALSGYMVFGLAQPSDPAPDVVFELQQTDDRLEYVLVLETGDELDGDDVKLQGVADPASLAGTRIAAGDELSFYPTTDTVTVVWYGDDDTSYVLWTVDIDQPLPVPDEGCAWVDHETNGGTNPVTIDDITVSCDVTTNEQIKVQNGGIIVGDIESEDKEFDGDDATVYGTVTVEKVLNHQDGTITGDATSRTADVKIGNGTIEGSVEAEKVAEVTDSSAISGDVESRTGEAKILGSAVEGSVTAKDQVKVQDAEIDGHVYIDSSDFDCTDSTIDGDDCGSYTPKDPLEW